MVKKFIYLQLVLIVISLGLVGYILAQIKPLTLEKEALQVEINKSVNTIDSLNKEIKKLTDPTIIPMAYKRSVPGVFSYLDLNGDGKQERYQNYDYTIWIKSSDLKLSKIKKVTYVLKDVSINGKNKVSTISSNRFTVSYRGWGTLNNVGVNIEYYEGDPESLVFDMTAFLENNPEVE